ncbi:hypothetical protein MRB53_038575 [Persea americana]|nr:hypothetical protein MRB53_038575 [Persea americana]
MAHVVAANVVSIITSFDYAADVLEQIRKKHTTTKASAKTAYESLLRSLQRGPIDIERIYRRCLGEAGQHFAAGDKHAEEALSRVLSRMNAGLVGTITSYLNVSKRQVHTMDFAALLKLSEISRKETIHSMSELSRRMIARFTRQETIKPQRVKQSTPQHQIEVRKKSSPKIAQVTIENSSKRAQLAIVKPVNKRSITSTSSSNLSKVRSASSSTTAVNSVKSPKPKDIKQASKSSPNISRLPARKLSNQDLPRDEKSHMKAALARPMMQQRSSSDFASEIKSNVTSKSAPRAAPIRRKFTPTLYSIATDSTKLGEIPLHRWAVPYDFDAMSALNRQALDNGWPLVDPKGNAMVKPRRRFGITALFRRKSNDSA